MLLSDEYIGLRSTRLGFGAEAFSSGLSAEWGPPGILLTNNAEYLLIRAGKAYTGPQLSIQGLQV